jgi:hypothetical protein
MIPDKLPSPEAGVDPGFPACAKPWHGRAFWLDASAGEGRSEKEVFGKDHAPPIE